MEHIDTSRFSDMSLDYRPDPANVPPSDVTNPESGPIVLAFHLYYTMHAESQFLYLQSQQGVLNIVEAPSCWDWTEFPEGNRRLQVRTWPTLLEFVSFLEESTEGEPPWSWCLIEALEELEDQVEELSWPLQNLTIECELYPELPVFYEVLTRVIWEELHRNGQFPSHDEWSQAMTTLLTSLRTVRAN